MSFGRTEENGKDIILFLDPSDDIAPEKKEEQEPQQAYNEETGEINWDCPCIAPMVKPPCGDTFKEAFSCFVYSKEEPKGLDCVEQFRAMQAYPSTFGNLDGSIKKNTGFIKKLKAGITSQTYPQIQKEMLGLKLEKYLEEIAASIAEASYKNTADLLSAVELISLLHQRFDGFSPTLIALVRKSLGPPPAPQPYSEQREKEEQQRLSKQKSSLRLLTELYLVGLADDGKQKGGLIPQVLHELLNTDRTQHANLSLASNFAKFYGEFFLEEQDLVPAPIRIACTQVLKSYFESRLKKLEKSADELSLSRNAQNDDKKELLERRKKNFDKLKQGAEILSQCLKLEMPELKEEEEESQMVIGIADGRNSRGDKDTGVWDDEETQAFYENLVDLSNVVPQAVLSNQSSKEETEDDDKVDVASKTEFDALTAKLLNALNRELIDQLAVEFAYMNAGVSRRQMTKFLFGVSKSRLELLPYYCRFMAILNPYMPDIAKFIVEQLDTKFHAQVKKKDTFLEERIKVVRYIGELVKFKLCPVIIPLRFLKVLLDDFQGLHIDLATTLLECCGRFLYQLQESHEKMSQLLEILIRKKTVQNMDQRHKIMIENAIYQVNPPEQPIIQQQERSPLELFLRKLLYKDLTRNKATVIQKTLRKIDWNNPETKQLITRLFCKIWKVKFSNIHLIAYLVGELAPYHPDFGVYIVDDVIESIRMGLETNVFSQNQQRVACAKYLAELYNYRMINSGVIFDTLYLLLRFGHDQGIPKQNTSPLMDAEDDYFRLRLVCTMLEGCGMCFKKGRNALYIFCKKKPMPMDVEFMINDTFDTLRPQMYRFPNYETAALELNNRNAQEATMQMDQESDDEPDPEPEVEEEPVVEQEPEKTVEQQETMDMDDFELEFAKVMNESMEGRKSERKTTMIDFSVPSKVKVAPNSAGEGLVAFTLGKVLALPETSSFARTTLSKQQAENEERSRLKALVLDYDERQSVKPIN
ncbi:armadillo-type protein [Gorgonomyces haynaldii]|nr:armadillo-type protein [Gorgonomyces haynaldii]